MKQFILTVLVAVVAAFGAVKVMAPGEAEAQKETALERVLRTGTLRCAYVLYPTYIDKDPNTGKMSGLTHDISEALAKALGLKVEWTAEVAVGEVFQGMGTKFDANCAGFWRTPERARGGDFSRPLFFTPSYIYVRADDGRFKAVEDFNKPEVVFSGLDGEGTTRILQARFPNAKVHSLPNLTPATDRFLAVIGKKADATAMEGSIGAEFMAKNPGKLKQFPVPLASLPNVIVLPHGEQELKNFLDAGIAHLLEQGEMAALIDKHIKFKGTVILPASEAVQ